MYYFVSDIHLGSGDASEARATERRFLDFLKSIEADAEALFLVGDIFDFWFEYQRVVPKGFVRVLGQLASMCDRGTRVVLLTGNHDMWMRDYLAEECGVEIHFAPIVECLAGKRCFIAHGDNMNIANLPVLRFMNRMFRSRGLKWLFSWFIHPDYAVRFGQWWSGKSRKSHSAPRGAEVLRPLIDYAADYHREHSDIDYFIFGHMHHMADVESPCRVLFMGDWQSTPNYLALNDEGEITLNIIK